MMFFKFLHTRQIAEKLGKEFVESVVFFVRVHVEPHERYFCFYLRKIFAILMNM